MGLSPVISLIAGLVLLVLGADYFVKGAVSLARRSGISALVIGLTVVAFGTSAPELAINLLSAARGSTDLAVGNVFGSNIANILLILGAAAVIYPVVVRRETVWKQIPLSLLAVLVVLIMGSDSFLNGNQPNVLSRADGLILLAFGAFFLYRTVRTGWSDGRLPSDEFAKLPVFPTWLRIIGGLGGLVLGGELVVAAATALARGLGVSENLIGLTVVAIGTSLPELATSVVAAWRRQPDIAVGNVVGSNVINVFFVLGLTATVHPIAFSTRSFRDGLAAAAVSLLLFLSLFVGRRHVLDRWRGLLFVAAYVATMAVLVAGG